MGFTEARRAIEGGFSTTLELCEKTRIPRQEVLKWGKKFFIPGTFSHYPRTPRLVNHFSLGADPEFAFTEGEEPNQRYVYAEKYGLTTLEAFGCDMSGRQAELRARPSKFALEVVASLVDSLRWMGATHNLGKINWSAVSFIERDGCGGHVHLGRKRNIKIIERDTVNLDSATRLLLSAGVLNEEDFKFRQVITKNGQWGDIRTASHGFEYRTLPTWMSSIWQAYLVIVVSKLIVLYGNNIPVIPGKAEIQIKNLLRFYRYMDDDAAIALASMEIFGMPIPSKTDLKARWGVSSKTRYLNPKKHFFPPVIQPSQATCEEVFNYLVRNIAVPQREPEVTWEPFVLPPRTFRVAVQNHAMGYLHDIGAGLISKDVPVYIEQGGRGLGIWTPVPLSYWEIRKALNERGIFDPLEFSPSDDSSMRIYISLGIKQERENCAKIREVLSNSSLFPICKGELFKDTDWSKWDTRKVKSSANFLGKEIGKVGRLKEESLFPASGNGIYMKNENGRE